MGTNTILDLDTPKRAVQQGGSSTSVRTERTAPSPATSITF
jgi:hypothetical protein